MAAFSSIALGTLAATTVAGTAAGLLKNNDTKNQSGVTSIDPASGGETNAIAGRDQAFQGLQGLVGQGPGGADVGRSLDASRGYADLLGEYSKSGGLPNQADIDASNKFATSIFDPQREALKQSFVTQNTEAERLAARLGRPVNDPIIQAKLRTGMMNQEALLNSSQGAFGSQLALQMPGQRVGYAGQQASTLGNLASQAFTNRAALLGMGSQIGNEDRNFRLNTASRYSNTEGGAGQGYNAIAGGLAGAGTGLQIASLFGAGGIGGGGGLGVGSMNFNGGQGATMPGGFGGGVGTLPATSYNLGRNFALA